MKNFEEAESKTHGGLSPRPARTQGLGGVYQPKYRDRKTREWRESPTWWVRYSWRGRLYRESSHSTRRGLAVRLLRRRLGELDKGRLVGPDAEKTTFEDLARIILDDYQVNGRKSFKRVENALTRLREFFGFSRALDITSDRVNTYIKARQEAGAKPATIRYELAILKRGFALAIKAERLAQSPSFPSIEVRNVRTGFFEEPEFRAVLPHLLADVQPVVDFAYLTGWRIGEILPLQWRQVDFKAQTVRLEPGTTKNDDGRVFPFMAFPALEALLQRQRKRTEELQKVTKQIIPWLFHRGGTPIKDFRGAWQQACKAAGVPGRLVHDLRRTAVRNLERAGVPRSVAMKLTGHKTESVYRRYAIVSEADLSEGIAKLAAFLNHQTSVQRTILPLKKKVSKAQAKQAGGDG